MEFYGIFLVHFNFDFYVFSVFASYFFLVLARKIISAQGHISVTYSIERCFFLGRRILFIFFALCSVQSGIFLYFQIT